MFLLDMSRHCPSLNWQEEAKKYLVKFDQIIHLCQGTGKSSPDREKIAERLYDVWQSAKLESGIFATTRWWDLFEVTKEMWRRKADQIIDLIKGD